MARHLPPGLTDGQRYALSQFFDGHMSAGQLSQRLSQEAMQAPQKVQQPRQLRPRFRLHTGGRSRSIPDAAG